jgi:hypothetical protein
MQKIFFSVLTVLLLATTSFAQKKSPGYKKLDWGLKSGINFSTLHGSGTKSLNPGWKTGFVFGAFFRLNKLKKVVIQPELLYSSMGGHLGDGANTAKSSYRVNYFSIPVLARISLCKDKQKFFAVVGPQADILLYAKQVENNEGTAVTNDFKDFSFNGTAGIEYWPHREIGLSARYIYGFSNIVKTGGDVKNMGAQLTLAVKL